MFDKLTQAEDVFAETDKAAPQPVAPTSPPPPPAEPQTPPTILESRMAELTAQKSAGSGLKVAVIIVAILVVIGGAFFISWRILSSRTAVTPQAPDEKTSSEKAPEVLEEEEVVTPEPEPEPEPVAAEIDTDNDGLSDEREAQYNTNIASADTDNDGLFDREEIEVYFTDPLNADTDGDTFLDGSEVKAGYNPKGSGKLLEIPSGS